jgi:hypothetical protein
MAHGTENWYGQHRSTFAIAAELIEQNLLHPEKLLTHRFALTNFKEAIHALKRKDQTRAIKVVFDYALLPASVVPNVRSSARQRRPARVTTAAWPAQEEKQANGTEEAWVEAGTANQAPAGGWTQPEAEYEPAGRSWVQQVQPFPPAVTEEVEPEPAPQAVTEENAQAAIPSTDDEWAMQGQAVEQEQKPMDETMLFYTYEEPEGEGQPELTGEEETQRVAVLGIRYESEQQVPEPIHLDTGEVEQQEQREPQPILLNIGEAEQPAPEPVHLDAGEQVVIPADTPESEAETATVKIQKSGLSGRKRSRSGRGNTESQVDATKDAPDTL